MAIKKELFINSIKMVQVDDRENIPSVVHFSASGARIGHEALDSAQDPTELNENFKIALGESARGRLDPPKFETGDGQDRSAHDITKVFFEHLLNSVAPWFESRGLQRAKRVLIAEPLALDRTEEEAEEWLANYRSKLRHLLASHFDEIDFLPEPFAVFQYYRYGIRHALLTASKRHAALVIDFGGGTFDVSVVDTTASGDVSRSGRNSRPLAAASVPVGGSSINLAVSRELLLRCLEKSVDKGRVAKGWDAFRHGAYLELRPDLRQFVRNARRVMHQVEKAKLHICDTIADWSLDAEYAAGPAMQIEVPTNPFAEKPTWVQVRLDALQLRNVFINSIWNARLKTTIQSAIARAKEDLHGRPIELVLLSGGSANIRWLTRLLEQMIQEFFPDAQILELQGSFQEVVSKGLAVECARRTFNAGTSDFKAVTYNRLCLVLGADGEPPVARRYRPLPDDSNARADGTLLESAFIVSGDEERPLRWKFRLPSPPKHHLDYYFIKSSLDYTDVQGLYNIDHRVNTPKNVRFDSSVLLELTVSHDGTARPRFVYRQAGPNSPEAAVVGRPFFLDMTSAQETTLGEAYVGIDFGTTNSSVSYVEQSAVRQYTERASDKSWRELNDLVAVLPYPVANPLLQFLASASENEMNGCFSTAFEYLLFTLMTVAMADYRCLPEAQKSAIFRQFTKGSPGPIWSVLRSILEKKPKNSVFIHRMTSLLELRNRDTIDRAIAAVNDLKHQRLSTYTGQREILSVLGNCLCQTLSEWRFGRFEGVKKKGFSATYSGAFRVANSAHPPFMEVWTYEGAESFSELEMVLVNPEAGEALKVAPLMFWTEPDTRGEQHVAILDGLSQKGAEYKLVAVKSALVVDEKSELRPLRDSALSMAEKDGAEPSARLTNCTLSAKSAMFS